MSTYAITGTSKGVGLSLTEQLLDLPSTQIAHIFALSRGAPTPALASLIQNSNGRVTHVKCAVDNDESVQQAAAEVEKALDGKGLDVLVNNAGIGGASKTLTMEGYSTEFLSQLLDTNVTGVHRCTVAFLPLLRKGKEKKVINMTSTLGSMAWAEHFSVVPTQGYKVSKAALHMLNKQFAMDLAGDGFTFLCISPGHLKTDLGGNGDFEVDVGAKEVRRIMLDAGSEMNGKSVNIHVPGWENAMGKYDGGQIPW